MSESCIDSSILQGLSILIPIYNQNVLQFVTALAHQAQALEIGTEIICLDDGSAPYWKKQNSALVDLNIIYKELPTNVGRSKIRNLLAQKSRYSKLLFLDCDGQVEDNRFLNKYIDYIHLPVVIGGRVYSLQPPDIQEYVLHWQVGKAKEEQQADVRNKRPYKSFMFNNILISREVYVSLWLDEGISTYGHEDTKFGTALEQKKIPVVHIDNPVMHLLLDNTEDFLKKTEAAVRNFNLLLAQGIGKDTALYKAYNSIKLINCSRLWLYLYETLLQKIIHKNLKSRRPSIVMYDLYKLHLLLELNQKA